MTDYTRFITSKPINRQAAMTVSARGIHWTPQLKPHDALRQHEGPPPCVPLLAVPENVRDLIGANFGRFTVTGYIGKRNPKGKAVFVVRCNCGMYEERTSKAIRNPSNAHDACRECRHLAHVKQMRAGR